MPKIKILKKLKEALLGELSEEEEEEEYEEELEEKEAPEKEEVPSTTGLPETGLEEQAEEEELVKGEFGIRLTQKPRVISVVSNKGGVGKSTIAAGLVLLAGVYSSNIKPVAVDLDPDNATLTNYLLVNKKAASDLLNPPLTFMTFVKQMFPSKCDIIMQKRKIEVCMQKFVDSRYFLVPFSWEDPRDAVVKFLSSDILVNKAIAVMMNKFLEVTKKKNLSFIIDAKQKSLTGVRGELLYKYLVPESDVVIIVTEPEYIHTGLINQYLQERMRARSTTIFVVNKYDPRYASVVNAFRKAVASYGCPLFVLPKIKEGQLGVTEPGDSATLYYQTLLYIAYYLGLASEDKIKLYKCDRPMGKKKLCIKKIGDLYYKLIWSTTTE